ncbi:winged helix-turn-helix transcriptional regulator [Mycobacterium hubeiense]|uniref:winged helix-turn-helix transcriptional regulator n=1 Tax=Mycobacterium hubeiense TaxID=1867256 RepID=UPI000C7F54CC|nr:winged helix-turn-helix transcriptional regulator [Mycobacterium sp. QGD 101]
MSSRTYKQRCPVATALDLLGERWTLLIVRNLVHGPKRFTDIADDLAGIGTGLLSTRLRHLQDIGVIERATLPPPVELAVYQLTTDGQQLRPLILDLARWGLTRLKSSAPRCGAVSPAMVMIALESRFEPAKATGVLRPARVGSNGYRYYEREQLLRLQQILLLRDLGLDLTTIGKVVDAQHDPIEALRQHHRRLLDERGRLDRLAATVAATIKHLEEGTEMPAEHMFEGFEMSPEYLDNLEARRVESTGSTEQPEIAEIKRHTAEWSSQHWSEFNAEGHDLTREELSRPVDRGVSGDLRSGLLIAV